MTRSSRPSGPPFPPTIAKLLRERTSQIPQPYGAASPRNVIRGQFFADDQPGWAILSSVRNVSTLLVFRNDMDAQSAVVNTSDDRNDHQGMGGTKIGYSHEITTVDARFITHHAIDDSFNGKASVTLYFYQGKWLRLQGAD